ncbi:MAG: RagB/SusD family nutrient uptake outer membrane protein [Agriterribacter sp.]
MKPGKIISTISPVRKRTGNDTKANRRHLRPALCMLIVFTLFSCKRNILDTKPFDKFDENAVWSSRAGADAFVNNVYASVMSLYTTQTSHIQQDTWTTNAVTGGCGQVDYSSIWAERLTRDDDYGFNQFSNVRLCNLIIDKANASASLSESDKTQLTAEAKFLRAMTYYWLGRRFGKVIWVDSLLTPEDNFKLPQTQNIAETYAHIMADINDAIQGLPEDVLSGKAGKYAALALKTEVGLQAAAYTGDDSYYAQVVDAATTIINSGKYTLDANYEGMFNEQGRYSSELIFAVYRDKANTNCDNIDDMQHVVPNQNNDNVSKFGLEPSFKVDKIFEAWASYGPSQNLVDDYLVIDKADPSKALRWDATSQFTSNMTKVNSSFVDSARLTGTGSVSSLMYANRDKRFYGTIVYDSCTWFDETVTTNANGNLNRYCKGVGGLGGCTSVTNYMFRKGVYNVEPRVFYGIPSNYHWVIFRLGRVYLNLAEALLKQGKTVDAVNALNETRSIHGGLPASTAASSADAWVDYKRERRVELAKELDYYWSLMRWGKYGGDANHGNAPGGKIPELTEKPSTIEINASRTGYRIEVVNYGSADIRNFDESRRYLLPIPNSQIVRHGPGLDQNPGY